MGKAHLDWCDLVEWDELEEAAALRACIPTQQVWYDMEEYDYLENAGAAMPWLPPSPSASGDREDFAMDDVVRLAPIHCYLPECMTPCTWTDEIKGTQFKTYALRVNFPLDVLGACLMCFMDNQAAIYEIGAWSMTASFGSFAYKVQAHPWLNGLLVEFELLGGSEIAFLGAVGEAGNYIGEVDRHWEIMRGCAHV